MLESCITGVVGGRDITPNRQRLNINLIVSFISPNKAADLYREVF